MGEEKELFSDFGDIIKDSATWYFFGGDEDERWLADVIIRQFARAKPKGDKCNYRGCRKKAEIVALTKKDTDPPVNFCRNHYELMKKEKETTGKVDVPLEF